MGCCTDEESERLKHLRGLDRAPTADEAADPPDKRPSVSYTHLTLPTTPYV